MPEVEAAVPAAEVDESWVDLAQERINRQKEKEAPATPPKEEVKTAPVPEAGKSSGEEDEEEAGKDGKPKGGFQRRIDKLTRQNGDLERTVSDLQGQIADLKKVNPQVKVEAKAEGDPEPKEEDFKDYKEFAKSLARWVARQELKADKETAKKADEDAARTASNERAKASFDSFIGDLRKAREDDAEFDKIIQSGWAVPDWVDFEVKRRGAAGAKIVIALAKNKAVYDEIIQLNNETLERGDRDFTEAYDAFAAFVRSLKSSTPEKPKEKPKSSAPEPISPIKGGSGPTEQNFDSESVSVADYRKQRKR